MDETTLNDVENMLRDARLLHTDALIDIHDAEDIRPVFTVTDMKDGVDTPPVRIRIDNVNRYPTPHEFHVLNSLLGFGDSHKQEAEFEMKCATECEEEYRKSEASYRKELAYQEAFAMLRPDMGPSTVAIEMRLGSMQACARRYADKAASAKHSSERIKRPYELARAYIAGLPTEE